MAKKTQDPAMEIIIQLFEESGKSLKQLGREMGYATATARKSAWQFIRKTDDPRLSMVRKFAKAMGVRIADIIGGDD